MVSQKQRRRYRSGNPYAASGRWWWSRQERKARVGEQEQRADKSAGKQATTHEAAES